MSNGTAQPRVEYGEDLLRQACPGFGSYALLTTRSPWALVQPVLDPPPAQVVIVESLERAFLNRTAAALAPVDSIVGIGGGMVVDAAKYVAHVRSGRLILVPSITSSDAMFSPTISVRENGTVVGMLGSAVPEAILIDYGLIRQGDPVWNRGGYGDLLCLHTVKEEWRWAAETRRKPWSAEIYDHLSQFVEKCFALAPAIGELSDAGIRGLIELTEETTTYWLAHREIMPLAGTDHLLAWNLEQVTGRHFVHGQVVALGTVVVAILQHNSPQRVSAAFQAARLPYSLQTLNVTWDEFEQALFTLPEYNRRVRHYDSILDDVPLTPERLAEIRQAVTVTP